MSRPTEILRSNLEYLIEGEGVFAIGDMVKKKSGSQWHGQIVGFYTTHFNTFGCCVESAFEKGSVQLYPDSALEPWNGL